MADAQGNSKENDDVGFNYQLCTLLYCILKIDNVQKVQGGIEDYKIGSAIAGYGALDDVVFKVTFTDGQELIYALQVKCTKDKEKNMIDSFYLWDDEKKYMPKYFQSYLQIKNNQQIGEMILWTNMNLNDNVRKVWFEKYSCDSQRIDLLGKGDADVPAQRYKFKKEKWDDFKQELHPRTMLIRKFIDKLFAKKEWDVNGAAENYYDSVMSKEIIEWKEDGPQFKMSFIQNDKLNDETNMFRQSFECIMKQRFIHKYSKEFSIDKLNSNEYKTYFELQLDAAVKNKSCTQADWKEWSNVPSDEDTKKFFEGFVFYTGLPELEDIQKIIGHELRNRSLRSYEQWCTLVRSFAFKGMTNQDQINKLFKLLEFREGVHCGPYKDLQFTDLNDLKMVGAFFNGKQQTFLCIKAIENVAYTLSRLIYVLEERFDSTSNRFFVLNYETYGKKPTLLETIRKDPKLVCLIITCRTCVPKKMMEAICEKMSKVQVIFVGKEFDVGLKTINDNFVTNEEISKTFDVIKLQQLVEPLFHTKSEKRLCIKITQNFSGTLSRVINIVEREMELLAKQWVSDTKILTCSPHGREISASKTKQRGDREKKPQYIVLNYETHDQSFIELETILSASRLAANGLFCVIIACKAFISLEKVEQIVNKLSLLKVIFVGNKFDTPLATINDEFDEGSNNEADDATLQLTRIKFLVGTFLNRKPPNFLCLKAKQSIANTLSRLIYVIEKQFELNSKQYVVLNYEIYAQNDTKFDDFLKAPKLIDIGLKCLIITCTTCIPKDKLEEIFNRISALNVILVGREFADGLTIIDDEFNENLFYQEICAMLDLNNIKQSVCTFFNDTNKTVLCIKATHSIACTLPRLIYAVETELAPRGKRFLVFNYKTYQAKFKDLEPVLMDRKLVEAGLECIIITCSTEASLKVVIEIKNKLSALKVIFVEKEFDEGLMTINDELDVKTVHIDTKLELLKIKKPVVAFFNGTNENLLCVKAVQNVACTLSRLIYVVEEELGYNRKQFLVINYEICDQNDTDLVDILKDPKLITSGLSCIIITCSTSITLDKIEKTGNRFSELKKIIFVGTKFEEGLKTIDDDFYEGLINDDISKILYFPNIKHSVNTIFNDEHEAVLCIKQVKNVACTLSRLVYAVAEELVPKNKRFLVLYHKTFQQKKADFVKFLMNPKLIEGGLECIIIICTAFNLLETMMKEIANKFSTLKVIFLRKEFTEELITIEDKFDVKLVSDDTIARLELYKIKLPIVTFLNKTNKSLICIKAIQNVDCTLSRLICAVEGELVPYSKRYLVLNYETYAQTALEVILDDPKLIEFGIKCIIMTGVPPNKIKEIGDKFSAATVIVVGNEFSEELTTIDDEFHVASITKMKQEQIKCTKIELSLKQCSKAEDMFGDTLFTQQFHKIVLELYKTELGKSIKIFPTNKLDKDSHYMPRLTERIATIGVQWDLLKQAINTLNKDNKRNFYRYIVSNQPGMGKSTELVRIAVDLREKYQDHLIVFLDCKNVASKWNGSVVEIVCDSLTPNNELTNAFVEKLFQHGKIVLLMDGYDEVSSGNHCNLDDFFVEMTTSLYKSIILFVATRPHFLQKLESNLPGAIVCILAPFSETDQEEYLKSFWKVEQVKNDKDKSVIMKNTRTIIDTFRAILKKNKSIIEIPLQTYMIAYIYKDDVSSENIRVPKSHEIGSIFEQFINLKFGTYTKHHNKMISAAEERRIKKERIEVFQSHTKIAEAFLYRMKILEQECLDNEHYGLVRLYPTVEFTHYTYYEYFITLYFLQYETKKNEAFELFMERNLCQSRLSIATKFLDYHISTINPKNALMSISMNNKSEARYPQDFTPPETALLHKNKIREFNLFLSENYTAEERCNLIRSSLNISVFNVLEVLYDSLPSDTKTKLSFCFGKKTEDNSTNPNDSSLLDAKMENQRFWVNLKPLGENQVLHLLKLLWKKHSDDFVQLYLTAFDDKDEDFIEVACRKPFVQVFKWLTTELVPNLNSEESRRLEEYFKRRFKKYFELVVQHNNAVFLEAVNCWVQKNWSTEVETETVKQFLQDNEVMLHFVTNVEMKAETKDFKVDSRVKMVKIVYDLFSWAFRSSTLSDTKCTLQRYVNSIKSIAIKNAFDETFFIQKITKSFVFETV